MDDNFDGMIVDLKKKHIQQRLHLMNTSRCVEMLRDARKNEMDLALVEELWLLIVAAAKNDWGEDTFVDDFSIEGKFVITNGKRRAEL